MKAYEIRSMSEAEIRSKIEESYEELFNLRFQRSFGQLKDFNQLKRLKKTIARLKTVLNERR